MSVEVERPKRQAEYDWPVVPMCAKQRLDINPEDLLEGGLFRKCDVYKGGGGYDHFPYICEQRLGVDANHVQFVVQLQGCVLKCPYCYVTEDGVHGEATKVSSSRLLKSYERSGLDVFHLMGGAPAMHLRYWKELASNVKVFHSDFLLVEGLYFYGDLRDLPGLHAVSLKERFLYRECQMILLWKNLQALISNGVNFYITFTGSDEFSSEIADRFGSEVLKDSFRIPIIDYKALAGKSLR